MYRKKYTFPRSSFSRNYLDTKKKSLFSH